MPVDCLLLILEETASNTSLTEVVQRSFVCNKWFTAVSRMMGSWRNSSLKLFNSEMNYDNYRQLVISETALNSGDERFALHDRAADWKQQDHLCLRNFTDTALDVITKVLQSFFSDVVTSLVINTFDIDQVEMLKAFPYVETITLIELPEARRIQTDIWAYLATRDNLRHLHLFHCESTIPLDVAQLRPILQRLESFTLHQYNHPNRIELLSCLNANVCQQICLGKFGSAMKANEFRLMLQQTQPELSQRLLILDRTPVAPTRQGLHIRHMHFFRRNVLVTRWLQTLFTNFPEERPEWLFLNPNPQRDQVRLAHFRHAFITRLNQTLGADFIENLGNEDRLYPPFFALYEQFRRGEWLPDMNADNENDIAEFLENGDIFVLRPWMIPIPNFPNANNQVANRARRNLLRNFVGKNTNFYSLNFELIFYV